MMVPAETGQSLSSAVLRDGWYGRGTLGGILTPEGWLAEVYESCHCAILIDLKRFESINGGARDRKLATFTLTDQQRRHS